MNKFEEAFYTITDWFHRYKNNNVTIQEVHITPKYKEAKRTIRELVEKEIPVKIVKQKITDMVDQTYDSYECPICKKGIFTILVPIQKIIHFKHKYCPECGQKLDWEIKK